MKFPINFRIFLLASLLSASCAVGQTIKVEGKTMGPISYRVLIDPLPEKLNQNETGQLIQAELDHVNELMSTYRPDSEVSRFNSSNVTDWFPVSNETAIVIKRALEISRQTQGAFDITVGPLVDLWSFGSKKENPTIPSADEVATTQESIGYQKLSVQLDPPTIKKAIPELQIDLSAIAKGFAVDQVANKLNAMGVKNYMIQVGGEVRTQGKKSDGSAWEIGVEKPVKVSQSDLQFRMDLTNQSMATSGDYRNFYVVDGQSYSHTIDPVTAAPVTHNLASVSVIAEDCMSADAYATAALVKGSEDARTMLDSLGLQYNLIERNENGFSTSFSSQFPKVRNADAGNSGNDSKSIWPVFLGAAVIFGLAILGMACGAILNNKPITGSCGGLSSTTGENGESNCSLCHKPTTECPDVESASTTTAT